MVEFTKAELKLILTLSSTKGQSGKPFSFKGLKDELEENGRTETELRNYAREIGRKIKASVEDEDDHQLNFKITHYYSPNTTKKMNGGSISYTLL